MPLSETGRKYPSLLEQKAKALPGSRTLDRLPKPIAILDKQSVRKSI
jgi:hypothetical protein